MNTLESKNFDFSDETRAFHKGRLQLLNIAGGTIGKAIFEPGWKWSTSLKDVTRTKSCEAAHFQYHVSGVLKVRMDDGTEKELKAGDISFVPPGHDSWVVGNEPVVVIDFQGMIDYAKEQMG